MTSRALFFRTSLAAAVLAVALAPVQARQAVPGVPPGVPGIEIEGLDEQIQQFVQDELARAFGRRPGSGSTLKWGGMALQKASPVLLDQLDLPADQGLVVARVEAGSQAAEAGLKTHDLLLKVDKQAVPNDP